ncbi:MAG TPA: sugar phosphate isomerase/epimerase [Phycisphaerae bacterium]|nr:sugar phosphate isomerase/epimerase [Phycisphaerae bacterium]
MPLPPLGVQSWCFREFVPLDALIAQLRALGLPCVEICERHADFSDEASFERVIGAFRAAGIQISSIGVQTFHGEPREESWFRFCKMAGAKMISANFEVAVSPEVLRKTQDLARKYDILLGIHNHGGYHWLGNAGMLEHLFRSAGDRLGLCLDTAWCLQAGEDPLKWVDRFRDRLFGVHLKDFRFSPQGQWEDVVLGTVSLKLPELLRALQTAPRLATLTIEYEGDVANPLPKLKECVERVRAA